MADDDKIVSLNSDNASEYVKTIMSSQRVTRVDTPIGSGRKRHLSEPDISSTIKKQPRMDGVDKGLNDAHKRNLAKAKRNLYSDSARKPQAASPNKTQKSNQSQKKQSKSPQNARKVGVTSADVHINGKDQPLESMINKSSSDMFMLFQSLDERIDKVESGLEQRIANKVSQVLDKRVSQEINRIRLAVDSDVKEAIGSFRDECKSEIETLNAKIESLSTNSTVNVSKDPSTDKTLNIVIRDLPESDNEVVESKVNKLFKDGLRIRDVKCEKAERKKSRNPSKPGVIIAKLKSHDEKRKVMFEKKSLKSNSQYSSVFIHHDQAPADRVLSNNFRSILSAMKSHGLTVRGSRVIPRRSRDDSGSPGNRGSREGTQGSRRDDSTAARDQRADDTARDQRADDRSWNDSRDRRDRGYHADKRGYGYGNREDGFTTVSGGRCSGQGSGVRGNGGRGSGGRGNGGRGNGRQGWNSGRRDY